MTDKFSLPGDTVKNYLTSVRSQDEDQITVETVEAAEDINDAFDLADILGVDMSGLDDLIEMQRRLVMHLESQDKSSFIEQIQIQLNEKSREDEKKRKNLIEFLRTCKQSMRSFRKLSDSGRVNDEGISTIGDILAVEGKPWNLDVELSRKIAEIEKGGCVFLVSGETNAGKSSFLNLLLDSNDILTVKAVSCTAVCTRIMYSEKTRVEILHRNGTLEQIKIDERQSLVDQIEKLLFDSEREHTTSVFEVRLFMPIALLKSGLVLVDTPGIGENHTMNNITEEFIDKSKTDGFIYIIKSDNAGGVQEDQLGELLKIIIQKEKEKAGKGEIPLDKKCTMFVCNHWDSLSTEHAQVYDNALQRLKTYFPMLTEDQVIRFSTKVAKQELSINRNYVTPDFKDILNRIRDMYFSATDNKIIATYKWMESILKRLTRHLRSIVQRTDESEDELEEKMRGAALRLDNLETKTDEVLKMLNQKVDSAKENIYQQFKSYLSTPHAKTRIIHWISSEVPSMESFSSWPEIKIELYERTSKRISNELAVWEEDNGIISAIRDDIVSIIKDELNLLEKEVKDIDNDVHAENQNLSCSDDRRKSMLLDGRVSLSVLTAPQMNDFQMSVIAKHLHPIGNVFRGFISGDKNRLKEYKEKPCKLAKEKADKFLKFLLDTPQGNEHLRTFISNLLEKPMELIRATKENVPSMITANRKLMQHIMHCKHDTRESRNAYEEMMEGLEDLKHQLLEYGEGEIFVQDFKGNEIKVCDPKDGSIAKTLKLSDLTGNSSSEHSVDTNVIRTLWTVLRNGIFSKESEDENIFLRMYVMSSGIDQTCGEVSKLRFLRHESVAELLGIHYFDGPLPAFVFRNHLKTLHQYFQRQRPKDTKYRILTEVIGGLEYLHRKKLVHMELNIHTITVDKTGSVKLSGACLPRKACLPLDKEAIQVSYFVYLPPGILKGETYLACDDIYSLGLLMYELILNQKPFHRERKWTLDQFIRDVSPLRMLGLEQAVPGLPELTRNLISKSLQSTADQRPIIQDFQNMDLYADEESIRFNETRGRRKNSYDFYKR